MHWLWAFGGAVLVTAVFVDVMATVMLSTVRSGLLTRLAAGGLWRAWKSARNRVPGIRLPGLLGLSATFAVVGAWIGLLLAGWFLIFSATADAVVSASTGLPGDHWSRLYFAAYALFTLGNGDFVPVTGVAQTLTWLATMSGLFLVTLTIAYLMPLRSAVSHKQALARVISSIGERPTDILINAWQGSNFNHLEQILFAVSPSLSLLAEQHLAYPVLHLYQARVRVAAVGPALAVLDEGLLLLSEVVAPRCRPSPLAVKPVEEAIGAFLETLPDPYAQPSSHAAPPGTRPLQDAGIPIVSHEEVEAAFERHADRRRRLRAVVEHEGWEWGRVEGAKAPGGAR